MDKQNKENGALNAENTKIPNTPETPTQQNQASKNTSNKSEPAIDSKNTNKQDPPSTTSTNTGFFSKVKEVLHNILSSFVIKSIFAALLCTLVFVISMLLVPRLLHKTSFFTRNNTKHYSLEYSNIGYFSGTPLIKTNIKTLCIDVIKEWSDSRRLVDFGNANMMLDTSLVNVEEQNINILAASKENAFIISNTEEITDDIRTYYITSYNILETGDVLMSSLSKHKASEDGYSLLAKLNAFTNVGILDFVHGSTWIKLLPCAFNTIIYSNIEKMINDLSSGKIQYAIAPRLNTLNSLYVIKGQGEEDSLTEIIVHDKPLASAGPILLISKDIKNAGDLIRSFNEYILSLASKNDVKLAIAYKKTVPLFPKQSKPNYDFL